MKNSMKMSNKLNLGIAFAVSVFLSSCGGGGSSALTTESSSVQVKGVAVDGYLAGSDVCLDLNINNSCDQDEPTSKTGSDGSYQLTFTPEDQAKPTFKTSPILIIGGVDIGLDKTKPDNKPFVGSLKALNVLNEDSAITEINLSPATKMLADGAMKQRKANSATFAIDDLTGFINDNEAKIKKAMKIPDDKPLTIDLSLAENIDSYQQSLSIHKALETMTKSQVQSQKASATATTQTSSDAMDDMYALAFDAILDDDFANTLEQGTFTATDLLTHIKTDESIKDKIPAGAEKALDRASKLADTVFKAFDGFKDDGKIDTAKMNRIEDVIKLEFDAFDDEIKDFDWTGGEDLTATTKITIADDFASDAFFDKSDDDFKDFIAIETLQIDDAFASVDDESLREIIDAVQVKSSQTSVAELFEDFDKFLEVVKTIDSSTFASTATTAFGKFDEYLDEQKKEAEAEEKELEAEKAKNADGYEVSLPYALYGVDVDYNNNSMTPRYWEALFAENLQLTLKDYIATKTTTQASWVLGDNSNDNFELDSSGNWVTERFDNSSISKTIEILDDKRILLKLDGVDYEKLKVFESDVSGETIYDDNLNSDVIMPEGSKRVLMSIERMADTYSLHYMPKDYNNGNETPYTSFADFIGGQCGDRWFTGNENGGYAFASNGTQTATEQNGWRSYTCDSSATSGNIVEVRNAWNGQYYTNSVVNENAGTWEKEAVNGTDIIIIKPNNPFKYSYGGGLEYPIVAMKDGKVWSGDFEPKGDGDSWYAYNQTAVEAVKTKALDIYNASQSENDGSDNSGDDNNDNGGDDSDNNSGDNGGNDSAPTSFAGLVSEYCGTNNGFGRKENDNNIKLSFECSNNQSATSGNLVSVDMNNLTITGTVGTWEIVTVDGVSILKTNPTTPTDWDSGGDKTIFAMKDGAIWQGEVEVQTNDSVYSGYNTTAGEAIKNAVKDVTSRGTTTEINTIEDGANLVSNSTEFIGDEKTIFWEFDYDGENGINVEYVKYYSMVLKDGVHSDKKFKYENGSWVERSNSNTEVRLQNGSWVSGATSNYTLQDGGKIVLGQYGTFEIYTKDVDDETITVLGASVILPSGSNRIYLKRVSVDTPDIYYLHHQVN
jgi:hypothetical protein